MLSLDAHAHFNPSRTSGELEGTGAVLAMTLSLAEAERVINRTEPNIVWGVGCHPRKTYAQDGFDLDHFQELVKKTGVVGEIGLDTGSPVPIETQLRVFRQILHLAAEIPRIVSIHSFRGTGLVLDELERTPVIAPILHWWTGSARETSRAVALGCCFSVHSAVARQSKFYTRVPPERLLVESDHGWGDPPEAIPCRIEWVEHLVAQGLKCTRKEVRRLAWRNLGRIMQETGTAGFFPTTFLERIQSVD